MSDISKELMAKVAQHAPDHYAYLLKTAEEVKQSPFRDEILQEIRGIMEKAAARAPRGGRARRGGRAPRGGGIPWRKGIAYVGAAAGAGVAMSLGGDLYEAVKRGLTKGHHYKNMLEENPDLRGKAKAPFVRRHFNTLHKFNPEYASDPNVAGSYIRQNLTLESDDISAIHSLVRARRDIQGARQLQGVPMFRPSEV